MQLPRLHNVRFTKPSGGFTVWVETNDCYASDEALLSAAVKNGVAFDPGCLFRVNTKRGQPAAMRLAFSSVDEAAIATGIERLQKTLHEASAKRHRQAA